jgi:hypothetical protein
MPDQPTQTTHCRTFDKAFTCTSIHTTLRKFNHPPYTHTSPPPKTTPCSCLPYCHSIPINTQNPQPLSPECLLHSQPLLLCQLLGIPLSRLQAAGDRQTQGTHTGQQGTGRRRGHTQVSRGQADAGDTHRSAGDRQMQGTHTGQQGTGRHRGHTQVSRGQADAGDTHRSAGDRQTQGTHTGQQTW